MDWMTSRCVFSQPFLTMISCLYHPRGLSCEFGACRWVTALCAGGMGLDLMNQIVQSLSLKIKLCLWAGKFACTQAWVIQLEYWLIWLCLGWASLGYLQMVLSKVVQVVWVCFGFWDFFSPWEVKKGNNKFSFPTILTWRIVTFYTPGKEPNSSSSLCPFKGPWERNPWDIKDPMGRTISFFPHSKACIHWSMYWRGVVSSLRASSWKARLCSVTAPCWVCIVLVRKLPILFQSRNAGPSSKGMQ